MSISFKKILLAGTALVAASFVPTQAQAVNRTLTANGTWASSGTCAATPTTDVTKACSGDAVAMTGTLTLTVTNDGTADDGNGLNTFDLGALTNSSGKASVDVQNDVLGESAMLDVTIDSVDVNGGFSVTRNDIGAFTYDTLVTVTNDLVADTTLKVINNEGTTTQSTTLNVGGKLTIGSTTTLTGGSSGGATADINVTGNATFTGAVAVNAGSGAGSDATLTLGGASNAFTGGLTLNDNGGDATLVLNGGGAQTVSGAITGNSSGEGTIEVNNSTGVTFTGVIGTTQLKQIIVADSSDTQDSAATFKAGVSAANITLGNGSGAQTNTLTFDASTTSFTVTGDVDGDGSDTNNIVVKSTVAGKTVTANGDWGSSFAINDLTLDGASLTTGANSDITATTINVGANTTLTSGTNATLNASTITIGSGGTVSTGATDASDVTANVDFSAAGGTLTLGTDADLFGNVDALGNIGTLNLNGGTQDVTGTVGSSFALASIKAGQTSGLVSTFSSTVNALAISGGAGIIAFSDDVTGDLSGAIISAGTGTIQFSGNVDGAISFGANDGTVTIADGKNITDTYGNGVGTVDATTAGKGTLTLLGASTVAGAVGGTKSLKVVNAGAGSGDSTFSSTVSATTVNITGTNTVNFGGAVVATNLKFNAAGTAAFDDNVTAAISFTAANDGTVTIADGKNITGSVTNTTTNNNGTLTLEGASTVSGAVGGAGKALKVVDAGSGSGDSSFLSTVDAQTINITGANTVNFGNTTTATDIVFWDTGTAAFAGNVAGAIDFNTYEGVATIASGKNLTGSADGGGTTAGTLTFLGGTQSASGNIGAGDAITALNAGNAGGATTFSGTVNADTINVGTGSAKFNGVTSALGLDFGGNGGTATLATGSFTGDIDNFTGAVGGGTLTLSAGAQTVSGTVGAVKALSIVNAGATGATSTFSSDVSTGVLNVTGKGTVVLNGLTGSVNFGGNKGTVTLASGTTVTGTIDNATGTGGTLELLGGVQTIGSAIGTVGALTKVKAGAAGGVATFSSTVNATTLEVNGTGAVVLNGLTGDLDFAGNDGTVTLSANTGVTGLVTNSGVAAGKLILGGGTQTVSGAVGGGSGLTSITAATALLDSSYFTGGTVNAATINLGAGTAAFSDAITSTTINTGTGSASFADTVTATTLNLDGGAYTFADNVTAAAINLDSGTADFGANVTGSLDFVDDGTANITAGSTFTGAIDNTTITPAGTLTFAGSATVTGSIGATKALKVLTLGGSGTTLSSGAFRAADTTNLGDNDVASSGAVTITSGQTLNVEATGIAGLTLSGGGITSATGATISASTKVAVDMSVAGYIADGAVFKVVDSTIGGSVATLTGGNITDNSFFFDFDQGASATDLDLVIDRPTLASLATTANGDAVGDALDTIGGSTGNLAAVQIALQNATSTAEIDSILDSLVPPTGGEAVVAAINENAAARTAVEIRMAELRTGDGTTGMAASSDGYISGENVWFQVYGQTATQDKIGGVEGYSSDTAGVALGLDSTNIYNNGVFGLAFNFGQTSAESDNATSTTTDVDTYGLNIYTSYDLGEDVFFNGQFGYAYNKISGARHDVVVPGDTALADYSSNQFSLKGAMGSDYAVDYSTTLTPSLSVDYTYLSTDGYSETGIGNAGLDVSTEAYNLLRLGVGLNTAWNLVNRDGSMLKPAVRAGYTYDLVSDRVETTSSFIAAPAITFATTGPEPDRSAFNLGGGLTYMTNSNWDISGNYDYTYKANYDAHAGVFRATARF